MGENRDLREWGVKKTKRDGKKTECLAGKGDERSEVR